MGIDLDGAADWCARGEVGIDIEVQCVGDSLGADPLRKAARDRFEEWAPAS
jgi:hypothetical protein